MAQVPFARKLAFASGGFGACLAAINAYLTFFYTNVALPISPENCFNGSGDGVY